MNSLSTLTSSSASSSAGSPYGGSMSSGHHHGHNNGSSIHHHHNYQYGSTKNIANNAPIPKHPRPNKTRATITALSAGLLSCIRDSEDEMDQLKSNIHDLSINSSQVCVYLY